MSRVVDEVTKLAEPQCTALGFELVDVEYVKEGRDMVLRLLIDKPGGVTVDDCALLSRQIDPILDAADPVASSYYLQVSSPGLDRSLKRETDFERFAGSLVQLRTYQAIGGQRNFRGVLTGLRDGNVAMEVEGEQVLIPLQQVAKANLVPQI
ncbi:MAG: ribosome maturation factor RimP [Limnochordia bacterium]